MWAAVEVWLVVAQRFGFGAKMCISVVFVIVFYDQIKIFLF